MRRTSYHERGRQRRRAHAMRRVAERHAADDGVRAIALRFAPAARTARTAGETTRPGVLRRLADWLEMVA
jgi:hypothetical protein